ncbi:hypothetical protein M0Q50_05855 [bacterium]|jgi:hypothetical protein|nr:hypothetical protein [bacterium]
MKEHKVLFILENFYGNIKGKLKCPIYNISIINNRNATYSRILKYFENTPYTLYFSETTPFVGINKTQKFPVDNDWIKKGIEYNDWFAVISCCKKAEIACKEIGYEPFMCFPHPTSWAWRKEMMPSCIKRLDEKLNNENNKNS